MDKSKLIDKHLKSNHSLICGNVHHYEVTGEVKGAFKQCLIEMLQEFKEECDGNKPKQITEPALNTCDVIERAFYAARERLNHPDFDYIYEDFEDYKKKHVL